MEDEEPGLALAEFVIGNHVTSLFLSFFTGSFYGFFFGGGFPYYNKLQKEIGYPYSNLSNLEDLVYVFISFLLLLEPCLLESS